MSLTTEMRAFLGAQDVRGAYLFDTVRNFMTRFGVTAIEAGDLLAQWVKETL